MVHLSFPLSCMAENKIKIISLFHKEWALQIKLQYPISFLRIAWINISAVPWSRIYPKGTAESTSLALMQYRKIRLLLLCMSHDQVDRKHKLSTILLKKKKKKERKKELLERTSKIIRMVIKVSRRQHRPLWWCMTYHLGSKRSKLFLLNIK